LFRSGAFFFQFWQVHSLPIHAFPTPSAPRPRTFRVFGIRVEEPSRTARYSGLSLDYFYGSIAPMGDSFRNSESEHSFSSDSDNEEEWFGINITDGILTSADIFQT
jgi:hypothetical protein